MSASTSLPGYLKTVGKVLGDQPGFLSIETVERDAQQPNPNGVAIFRPIRALLAK
jgi:hypothetical protein